MRPIKFVVIAILLAANVTAAEYKGRNLDGQPFSATAFSYDTGKYYYVDIEFDGTQATLTFDNGNTVTLELDDEEIEDPSNISAFGYESANYWDLYVDDLEAGSAAPSRRRRTTKVSTPAKPIPATPVTPSMPPRSDEQTLTVEPGNETGLSTVTTLCVTGDSIAARNRMRSSLVVLLSDRITLEPEDCVGKAAIMFIYDETEKLGMIARMDRQNKKVRVMFQTSGTDLEIATAVVGVFQKHRPQIVHDK